MSFASKMARMTHRVTYSEIGCQLNLRDIAEASYNIEYQTNPFERLLWRHRKLISTCMIYSSGKIICHGGKTTLRKYVRLLQKMGYAVNLKKIKFLTGSAVYNLSGIPDYRKIAKTMKGLYEPEIFHAVRFIKDGIHYIVYKSGKVAITGIKSEKDLDTKVNPVLLELEII